MCTLIKVSLTEVPDKLNWSRDHYCEVNWTRFKNQNVNIIKERSRTQIHFQGVNNGFVLLIKYFFARPHSEKRYQSGDNVNLWSPKGQCQRVHQRFKQSHAIFSSLPDEMGQSYMFALLVHWAHEKILVLVFHWLVGLGFSFLRFKILSMLMY